MLDFKYSDLRLRNTPVQARSWARLGRIFEAADQILASEGADGFTAARIAEVADVPVGSLYHLFDDKDAIAEAVAVRYWSALSELVEAAVEADEQQPLERPAAAVLETLADGFRERPGFLALWYGGLRTDAVRDATRPTRVAVGSAVERLLANHWPTSDEQLRRKLARTLVIAGDGLLREAFRIDPAGDRELLEESGLMLDLYTTARLCG